MTGTATEQELRSIFFTNVNGTGEDVMAFTYLTEEQLKAVYKKTGKITFDECYEVPSDQVRFYLYEPCILSEAEEEQALKMLSEK